MWYNRQVNESWPLSQTVKTSPSHGEDMGSIPVGVTTGSFKDEAANLFRAISSAGRAPGSQSGGQGFDPPMVHQNNIIRTLCRLVMGSDLLFLWKKLRTGNKETGRTADQGNPPGFFM